MRNPVERHETGESRSSHVATAIVSGLIGGLVGGALATWLFRRSDAEARSSGAVLEGALLIKDARSNPQQGRVRRDQANSLAVFRAAQVASRRDPWVLEEAFSRVADAPSMRAFGWLIEAGDAWITARQTSAALRTFTRAREVALRQVAANSSSREWERALSLSHERIGDTLVAQGRLDAALESYHAGLAIVRKLAAAAPSNSEWLSGLVVLHVKLGMLDAPGSSKAARREQLASAERLVEEMQESRRLREPHQQSWPAVIRKAIEELDRSPDA